MLPDPFVNAIPARKGAVVTLPCRTVGDDVVVVLGGSCVRKHRSRPYWPHRVFYRSESTLHNQPRFAQTKRIAAGAASDLTVNVVQLHVGNIGVGSSRPHRELCLTLNHRI